MKDNYISETDNRDGVEVNQIGNNSSNRTYIENVSFSIFGEYVGEKKELLDTFQEKLQEAQIAQGADLYLSKTLFFTLISFISVLTISALSLVGLYSYEIIDSILLLIISSVVSLIISVIVGSIVGVIHYIYPSFISSRRASQIDATLPTAVTFMFALNRGGMTFTQSLRKLAENEETYGEISNEASTIIQEMDFFSRDLLDALQRARQRTPSDKFADFIDDTVSTIDTGGELDQFLQEKADELLEEKKRDQENYLDTLELLGESYVTIFVAGPLLMIVVLVILAIMGELETLILDVLIYLGLPLANIMYLVVVSMISDSSEKTAREIEKESSDSKIVGEDVETEQIKKIEKAKEKRKRKELFSNPLRVFLENPNKSLIFTVPLSILYLVLALVSGLFEPSISAFYDDGVSQTLHAFIIPFFISAIPLSIFYEYQARKEKSIVYKIPDSLKTLASANKSGMSLGEALENTANNTPDDSVIGKELIQVRNEINWKHDVNAALIGFANRIRIPMITQTIKLITEANKSTGDIEEVISVAAENVTARVNLEKERKSNMMMYTAVIIISYLVFLFVVAILDYMLLSELGDMDGDFDGGGVGGDMGFDDLPAEKFNLAFYHGTIVQGVMSGIIAGYLSANDVRAGLKFAVIFCVLSTIVFTVL